MNYINIVPKFLGSVFQPVEMVDSQGAGGQPTGKQRGCKRGRGGQGGRGNRGAGRGPGGGQVGRGDSW
jgi:hypothetical protein